MINAGDDFMEILFKNTYVRNKELAKEIYCYFYFQRKILVVINIIISISFLINILSLIFQYTYNLEILIFAPAFILFQIFRYFYQVNAMVKQDNEVHDKEITVETIVTNGFIQNTASNGAVNKLEYSNIKSVVQTKNLILPHSKANLVYIFRKDTFTKGSKESFIKFLMNKGIKIK